jgi:hypothetical protein
MEQWTLSKDILETVLHVAEQWSQGVFILKPFNGDFVILAVTRVDPYSPSNNIHNTTVVGKDVTMLVQQKLNIANPQGASPVTTYIDNIKREQTWTVSHTETWYWVKVATVF